DGTTYVVKVSQVEYQRLTARRGMVVELPEPIRTSCVTLAHLETYEADLDGAEVDAVAISEMTPITVVDAPTAEKTAERVVAAIADEPDLRKRERMAHIASGLSKELVGAVETALEETDGIRRRRIIPLLGHLPSERAVPILIDFLETLDSDDVEYRAVKRSLAVHRQEAAEPLRDLLARTPVDAPKYIDLVRLMGRVGRPIDLAGLVEEFGQGDQFIRNERIRATASAGDAVLPKLFAVIGVDTTTAKARDALKAAYLIGKRKNRDELLTHSRTEVIAEVLRQAEDRRTLMLAFRAAQYFRVEGLVSLVERRFLDYSDPLVRKSAMTALARYPAPGARQVLEKALDDRSPDVRISAVTAIGHRKDRVRSVDALLTYARHEDWKPGQQQALDVLAEVEIPKVRKFFHTIIDKHRNSQLAVLAANTLGRASRPIEPELARDIALDAEAPDRLRLEMIDLLGMDDSDPGEAFLLTLLNPVELGRKVEDQELRRRFERRALLALGRRRSKQARSRLLKMAKTGSDRKLRQHAIRALAFYKGEDLVRALREWRPDAPPELRNTLDQTVRIIENRGAIDDIKKQIEATMEAEQTGSESPEPTDEADSSSSEHGREGKRQPAEGKR
ncbi:MAG: HEAT repeat domain-containing protein, partial [Bradymonadaceae bacterium]